MKEDIRANNIWKHRPQQVPLINTLLVNKVKSSNTEDGRNVFSLFYVFFPLSTQIWVFWKRRTMVYNLLLSNQKKWKKVHTIVTFFPQSHRNNGFAVYRFLYPQHLVMSTTGISQLAHTCNIQMSLQSLSQKQKLTFLTKKYILSEYYRVVEKFRFCFSLPNFILLILPPCNWYRQ